MENTRPTLARRPRQPRERAGQPPWRLPRHLHGKLEPLEPGQVEAIHATSLRILAEAGIEVMSAEARSVLRAAGAEVDESSGMVRLDPALTEQAIASAPRSFELTPRNRERQITLGGDALVFALAAGAPNVHDTQRGRRSGNFADYCELVRLAQHFNILHLLGNQVCAPTDLPANSRHLDCYRANLELTDKVFHCTAVGAGRALDAIRMVALARGITPEALAAEPSLMTIINLNSPRRFDPAMAEGLLCMARHGQAVVVTPFTLMGAMAPVTLAGALAQQNAEALFGVALVQLARPGCPVVYGGFTSNVDLRSGAPAFGTPENARANLASGQLARRYGLPYRSSAASASNAADAQGAYETQMSLWSAVMGRANLVYHAAGWQEGGLTASFEKLVMDVEMLQMMSAFLLPLAVDEASLAFDAIAAVPPGGHYFGSPHTLARYREAFYEPLLSNWQGHDAWADAGGEDATRRAAKIWMQALREYQPPPLDVSRREALEDYVARRREQIGDGEP